METDVLIVGASKILTGFIRPAKNFDFITGENPFEKLEKDSTENLKIK